MNKTSSKDALILQLFIGYILKGYRIFFSAER